MSVESRKYEVILPPDFPEELFVAVQGVIKHGGGKMLETSSSAAEASREILSQELAETSTIIPVPAEPAVRIRRAREIIKQEESVEPGTNMTYLEAQRSISANCHDIAIRFEKAFDVDLPEYRGLFATVRKLGKDPRIQEGRLSNYFEQEVNGVPVGYSFYLTTVRPYNEKYRQEKRYEIRKAIMFIRDAERSPTYWPEFDPNLYIKFNEGKIIGIGMRWDEKSDLDALRATIKGTLLESYLDRLCPPIDHKEFSRKKGLRVGKNFHSIYFDFDRASCEVTRNFEAKGGGDMDSLVAAFDYKLDESGTSMRRNGTEGSSHSDADLKADFGISLPESFPSTDYAKLVQSLFGLIPAH